MVLILAGATTDPAQLKLDLSGVNLDLIWGAALVAFGLGAVALAVSARTRK